MHHSIDSMDFVNFFWVRRFFDLHSPEFNNEDRQKNASASKTNTETFTRTGNPASYLRS